MKRLLGIAAILVVLASPARATRLNPAFELEGGASLVTVSDRYPSDETALWRPSLGLGFTLGSAPDARLAFRTGLLYRRTLTARRLDWASGPGIEYRDVMRANELRLPARLSWAPGAGRFAIEGGVVGTYVLRATSEVEYDGSLLTPTRPASPEAIIFMPFSGERDITDFVRRGNASVTAALRWTGRFSGRAMQLHARYEHGLLNVTTATGYDERARAILLGASLYW